MNSSQQSRAVGKLQSPSLTSYSSLAMLTVVDRGLCYSVEAARLG